MNRPSLRTGQAALPHPALQLVVGLHRSLANAPIVRYKVPPMVVSRYRGSQQTLSKELRVALLNCCSPFCVQRTFLVFFTFFALFVVSAFLPPLAPRVLARCLATTEAQSAPGQSSSGRSTGHERCSFPGS